MSVRSSELSHGSEIFHEQAVLTPKSLSRQIVGLHKISRPFLWSTRSNHTDMQVGILEVGFEDEVSDVAHDTI